MGRRHEHRGDFAGAGERGGGDEIAAAAMVRRGPGVISVAWEAVEVPPVYPGPIV
jgi:hypothetical protein